jgi:hypothetical protein
MTLRIADVPSPPSPRRAVRLRTAGDARRLIARTVNDLLRGKIDPAVAGKVGFLLGVFIRSIEVDELEKRIQALEELPDA